MITTPKDIMHKINPSGYDSVSGGNSLMQKQSSVSAVWVYIVKNFEGWLREKKNLGPLKMNRSQFAGF